MPVHRQRVGLLDGANFKDNGGGVGGQPMPYI